MSLKGLNYRKYGRAGKEVVAYPCTAMKFCIYGIGCKLAKSTDATG
jgi:hypothetical protein